MASLVTGIVAALVAVLTLANAQGNIKQCTFDANACGCKTEQGMISLKRFADKPLYAKDPQMNYEYHWNPCKDLTMGTKTAACIQHLPDESSDYDCGTHKSTSSSAADGNAVFHLDAADGQRHSEITCICKKNAVDQFEFQGEYPMGTYDFVLSGESCCPGASPPPPKGGSEGLSPGSILLIIFLVVLVVYLIGGVAFQAGVRKATGKERLPNINFWSALPGLMKDGFRFTFSCGSRVTNYEKI